jgi:FAD/FMN-containing dehydrogenase
MNKKELICYCTDASRLFGNAEKIFFPKNVLEVQEIIRISNFDIVPRGAGTGFVGGCVPKNSIVVDMTKMNRVLEFNSSKRIVVVETGITLKELNEKLMAKGFEFPIDPLNKGVSSIGGMISTNSSGKRAMRYGTIKDWIDEIEFVNGNGELIKTSKADLMEVCGMEGITGIIISAKLRVIPKIRRTASVFQSDSLDEVLNVGRRLKQEKEVVSIMLFSKLASKILEFPEKYNLVIEFDSERGKIRSEEYKKLFNSINNLYYKMGLNEYYNSEDPKLFFDKIKEFLVILESMNIPYLGYLGNGIVSPFFKDSEKDKRKDILGVMKRMQAKLGKYGYGITRKDFLESFESKIIQRIKARHDPHGKLNSGKLIDSYIKRSEIREVSEARPFIGEEISASKISREIRKPALEKTPEEKIEEFIKEASEVEEKEIKTEIENECGRIIIDTERNKVSPVSSNQTEIYQRFDDEKTEIRNKLKDYEQTFDSELSFEKRIKIEEFAKNVPREIAKTEMKAEIKTEYKEPVRESIPAKPKVPVDYNLIRNIMTNKGTNNSGSSNNNASNTNNSNQTSVAKRVENSKEEQELINRILGNRGFSLRDKKEEKK